MRGPIVITGFMGSGKSKVARELARRLNLVIVDLDEVITEQEERSPAQLIVENGEPYFRSVESNALRNLLQTGTAGIIALGGGAWIEETNRALIDEYGGTSVWLDVPFEVCWARIETSAEDRPLGKSRDQAQTLYERRKPIYQLATIHIPIPEENLPDLIADIERKLGGG